MIDRSLRWLLPGPGSKPGATTTQALPSRNLASAGYHQIFRSKLSIPTVRSAGATVDNRRLADG